MALRQDLRQLLNQVDSVIWCQKYYILETKVYIWDKPASLPFP